MFKIIVVCSLVVFANAGLLPDPHAYEEYEPAHYDFAYSVHDGHTGDVKEQQESRRGDNVQGSYSLVEPDGHKRIVHYSADAHSGFVVVVVEREGTVHAQPAVAVAHAAPIAVAHAAPVAVAHAAPVAVAHAAPAYQVAHAAPAYQVAHAAPAYQVSHAPLAVAHAAPAYQVAHAPLAIAHAAPALAVSHASHGISHQSYSSAPLVSHQAYAAPQVVSHQIAAAPVYQQQLGYASHGYANQGYGHSVASHGGYSTSSQVTHHGGYHH